MTSKTSADNMDYFKTDALWQKTMAMLARRDVSMQLTYPQDMSMKAQNLNTYGRAA